MEILTCKNKKCVCCGKEMINVKCNVKYCDNCRELIKNGNIKRILSKDKEYAEEHKKKKCTLSLLEITRLADAAGMSYAKYCLKYGI